MIQSKWILLTILIVCSVGAWPAQSHPSAAGSIAAKDQIPPKPGIWLEFRSSDNPDVLAPLISVNPTTIDFGSVNVGSTVTQDFTISNPGTETLSGQINYPGFLSIATATPGELRTLQSSHLPVVRPGARDTLSYSIPAGESRDYSLSFSPQDAMEFDSSVYITHNAAAPVQEIEVSGIGLQADLEIYGAPVDFVLAFGESGTEFLELRNMGNLPLTYTASRAPGSEFFSINGSTSTSGSIPPGDMVMLRIDIYASGTVGSTIGGIDILSNDPDLPFTRILVTRYVYNPNHPPIFSMPSYIYVPYNGSLPFYPSAYATDPDGDMLYFAVVADGPVRYFMNRLIPDPDWYGETEIQITASDGEFEISRNLRIIVNAPPVLDLPESFSFARNDSVFVNFAPYIYDPDDNIASLSITFMGNSAIRINQLGYRAWFSAPNGFAGSESITLRVNDGHNLVQGSFLVNVINHAPVLNLPTDFSLDQNSSLTVDFSPYISDPDGDIPVLSYSGNSSIGITQEDYSLTFSPIYDWFGSEEISFTISDGLLQASVVVPVTVNQVIDLDPPVLMISANMNGIFISWQPVDYAMEYQVYRASEPGGSYSLVATTGNTMYFESDPLQQAFYYVKAAYCRVEATSCRLKVIRD
ncbi:MAG: choice-of-anchor D domain-containing protein [Candidatus Cloacimonadota bacterium]